LGAELPLMRSLLIILAMLLGATLVRASPMNLSSETPGTGPAPTPRCSVFTGAAALPIPLDDGCSGAGLCSAAGMAAGICMQNPTAFTDNTFRQSGQTYINGDNPHVNLAGMVNWNVACVDYACGVDTTRWPYCNGTYVSPGNPTKPCSTDSSGVSTGFIDVSTYDFVTDPAGIGCQSVTDNRRGSTSRGEAAPYSEWCQVTASTTLNGFDLTPWSATAGAYICVGFEMQDSGSATSGTLTVTNSIFNFRHTTDPSCPAMVHGIFFSPWYKVLPSHRWIEKFWNNSINYDSQLSFSADGVNNYQPIGGTTPINFYAGAAGPDQRTVDVRYNLFQNLGSRAFIPATPCNGLVVDYNGIHNLGFNSGGSHGELYLNGNFITDHCPNYVGSPYAINSAWGTMQQFDTVGNMMWNDAGWASNLDAFIVYGGPIQNTADLVEVKESQFSLNVGVINPAGFWYLYQNPGSVAYPNSGSQSGGYATAITGDILQLQRTGCTSPPTVYVFATAGSVSRMGPAWAGQCAHNPGVGAYSLNCLVCSSASPGTPTGLSVTPVRQQWINGTVGANGAGFVWAPASGQQRAGKIAAMAPLTAPNNSGGAGYRDGTYTNVPLIYVTSQAMTGTGRGATADILISRGAVQSVTINAEGLVYIAGDGLTASAANIGPGAGFVSHVATISDPRLVNFTDFDLLVVQSNAADTYGAQSARGQWLTVTSIGIPMSCGAALSGLFPATYPTEVTPSQRSRVGYYTGLGNSFTHTIGNFFLNTSNSSNANTSSIGRHPWTGIYSGGWIIDQGCPN
jgi:hypothetical protein